MKRGGAIFLVGISICLSFPQGSAAQWVNAGSPGGGPAGVLEGRVPIETGTCHELTSLCGMDDSYGERETRLIRLLNRVANLTLQKKYAEALPLAQEALRLAETSFGSEDEAVAGVLNLVAALYRNQGNYTEAEPLLLRALSIRGKVQGPDHPDVAKTLRDLAGVYESQARYEEAEPLYLRALAIQEKAPGPDQAGLATTLNDLAALYYYQGKYEKAELLNKRALSIRERILGPDHPDIATSLNNLAALYSAQGRNGEAEPMYLRALAILEKVFGPDYPDIATSLNCLGLLYCNQGKYGEAERLIRRSLTIRKKTLGPEHPYVAESINSLAVLYDEQGKYEEAERLYRQALAIYEKAFGPDNIDVAQSLNNLGTLYTAQGRYGEAEPLYLRALSIREKAVGPEHLYVAQSLNNLAELYQNQGKFGEAEAPYRRALAIREKALGPEHADVATSLNNLAVLYRSQGKYGEAESLYRRALAIREKALGPDHPLIAKSLDNLAELCSYQGKYGEAEPLYRRALAIFEKALGPDHPDVAVSLINLAGLYHHQGKYGEAEPLYRRALAVSEKALGADHPFVATSLNGLAAIFNSRGEIGEAEPLFRRAMAICERALGPDNPQTAMSQNNLAMLYSGQGKFMEAEPLFDRALQNINSRIERQFAYMSEKERLGFLSTVSSFFNSYFGFCFIYHEQDPTLAGRMYDVVLWQKGLVVSSVASLRSKIGASGDKEALTLLEKLTAKKTQLATLLTVQSADREAWRKSVTLLENEANELEKDLVQRSSTLAEEKKLAHLTWRDVQKSLKPGEAAVEIISFQFSAEAGEKQMDLTEYVALIVTAETTTAPILVPIGEAKDIEEGPLREYRRLVGSGQPRPLSARTSFYEVFWKPLEPAFGAAKRIYLAPDGALSQVSLAVVPRSDGRLLADEYDLRIVSSTKDLLREKHVPTSNSAILIGDPDFGLAETPQRAAVRSLQKSGTSGPALMASAGRGMRSREVSGGTLDSLPGTALELQAVDTLLEKQSWTVEVHTGSDALEESVKRVNSPRLLHLATHGFFEPDQKLARSDIPVDQPSGMEDPMLRSGLYFAGANRVLSGAASAADLEDGVLTAYEASQLDLQGTELVVLSACESGLGETVAGEGVFGLRRALQVAGAEAVLMSMWPVPDQETQELMALFYKKWLAGESKPEALRQAQREMRERVKVRYGNDLPLYWGAFVLVGR